MVNVENYLNTENLHPHMSHERHICMMRDTVMIVAERQ